MSRSRSLCNYNFILLNKKYKFGHFNFRQFGISHDSLCVFILVAYAVGGTRTIVFHLFLPLRLTLFSTNTVVSLADEGNKLEIF